MSTPESGADAGESKSAETEKELTASAETPTGKSEPAASIPSSTDPSVESQETNKVLSYGPAQRDPEPPEIKAHQMRESDAAPEIKAEKATAADAAPKKDPQPGSSLVPFVAKAKENTAEKPAAEEVRAPKFELLRSRGMQAALIAAFAGIGWAFAGSTFSDHSAAVAPQQIAAVPAAVDARHQPIADNSETRHLTDEIRALKKELDGLRSSVAQNSSQEEMRTLKKSVDSLRNGLEGTKSEVSASLAQLSAKLDKAQHDPAKLREISDRLDHIEHPASLTTASITPPQEPAVKPVQAPVPLPPTKAQSPSPSQTMAAKPGAQAQTNVPATAASPAPEKSQLIANWVVRDVYDGIALVEGPHGSVEVIEGETIPGVGTVKSIEKRGSGWIVVTSRGLVDSARN
jgi:hypothetical protein